MKGERRKGERGGMMRERDRWMGGKLLSAIKSFYEAVSACFKINGETSEHFEIKVGLRQGCVMSPWLFNVYMDGVMRGVGGKVGEVGVRR